MKNKTTLLLICIILLSSFLRLWKLADVPPSLYWDEVSQAYNAYSILETGKDEHGEVLPISRFKAFGDYKAPVLIYLMVPSLALFGKSDFAVRFPSALFGILTVLTTFYLVRELFWNHKRRDLIGLISSVLLAISPWHIQLSRGAYEANIAQFFLVFGVFLFLKSVRLRSWLIVASAVSLVVSMYAFNSHRFTVPILVVMLGIVYFKKLFEFKSKVIVSIIIGTILLIPLFSFLTSTEGRLRFNEVNIFTDLSVIEESNRLQALDDYSLVSRVVHNRRVLYARSYIVHYFDFFNPTYLFISGDGNPRFSMQDVGQLYIITVPFLALGFYILGRRRYKESLVILLWFIIAPVAAATARETPHALRSITYMPTYEIIIALGILYSTYLAKRYLPRFSSLIISFIIVGFVFSWGYFYYTYMVHFPITYAREWQYGYRQAVEYTSQIQDNYDRVVFTNEYGRPHIYVAYYGSVKPDEYWQSVVSERDYYGLYAVSRLGKYDFVNSDTTDGLGNKTLFVITPNEYNESMKIIHTIHFPDGTPAFLIAEYET